MVKAIPKAKLTQKDKQKRGEDFEAEITKALKAIGAWQKKFLTGFAGTPFDKVATTEAGGWAIECKRTMEKRLPYSAFTDSERVGLTAFEKPPHTCSIILVNYNVPGVSKTYLVPWSAIRDAVLEATRGSVDYTKYTEIPKKGGIWDLSVLKEGVIFC